MPPLPSGPVLYSLLAYIAGLVMYILDLPECLRPGGTFDILLHSHQFWHCAIVGAIALHWWALTGMSEKVRFRLLEVELQPRL